MPCGQHTASWTISIWPTGLEWKWTKFKTVSWKPAFLRALIHYNILDSWCRHVKIIPNMLAYAEDEVKKIHLKPKNGLKLWVWKGMTFLQRKMCRNPDKHMNRVQFKHIAYKLKHKLDTVIFLSPRGRKLTRHDVYWRRRPRTAQNSSYPQVLLSLRVLSGAEKHEEGNLRAYAGFKANSREESQIFTAAFCLMIFPMHLNNTDITAFS